MKALLNLAKAVTVDFTYCGKSLGIGKNNGIEVFEQFTNDGKRILTSLTKEGNPYKTVEIFPCKRIDFLRYESATKCMNGEQHGITKLKFRAPADRYVTQVTEHTTGDTATITRDVIRPKMGEDKVEFTMAKTNIKDGIKETIKKDYTGESVHYTSEPLGQNADGNYFDATYSRHDPQLTFKSYALHDGKSAPIQLADVPGASIPRGRFWLSWYRGTWRNHWRPELNKKDPAIHPDILGNIGNELDTKLSRLI